MHSFTRPITIGIVVFQLVCVVLILGNDHVQRGDFPLSFFVPEHKMYYLHFKAAASSNGQSLPNVFLGFSQDEYSNGGRSLQLVNQTFPVLEYVYGTHAVAFEVTHAKRRGSAFILTCRSPGKYFGNFVYFDEPSQRLILHPSQSTQFTPFHVNGQRYILQVQTLQVNQSEKQRTGYVGFQHNNIGRGETGTVHPFTELNPIQTIAFRFSDTNTHKLVTCPLPSTASTSNSACEKTKNSHLTLKLQYSILMDRPNLLEYFPDSGLKLRLAEQDFIHLGTDKTLALELEQAISSFPALVPPIQRPIQPLLPLSDQEKLKEGMYYLNFEVDEPLKKGRGKGKKSKHHIASKYVGRHGQANANKLSLAHEKNSAENLILVKSRNEAMPLLLRYVKSIHGASDAFTLECPKELCDEKNDGVTSSVGVSPDGQSLVLDHHHHSTAFRLRKSFGGAYYLQVVDVHQADVDKSTSLFPFVGLRGVSSNQIHLLYDHKVSLSFPAHFRPVTSFQYMPKNEVGLDATSPSKERFTQAVGMPRTSYIRQTWRPAKNRPMIPQIHHRPSDALPTLRERSHRMFRPSSRLMSPPSLALRAT